MSDDLRPVCFIAMPFRRKRTGTDRKGAPSEVDFDALWDKAYRPAIEDAGFTAVRADLDTGSVIIKDMLERLAYADLVLADVSLPNGNVYYEVGLRHAAREAGCILFAADWSRQLFDIDQFTAVRYALDDGDVGDAEAEAIRAIVAGSIKSLKASRTPWYEFIGAKQPKWPRGSETVFRAEAQKLSAFQADLRALRLEADKARRAQLIETKMKELEGSTALTIPQAAIEMLCHVRDHLGWAEVLDLIDSFDPCIRALHVIEEQRLLALAKTGEPEQAITHMKALVDRFGETPERLGIIGGRYKQLWRAAREAGHSAAEARFLDEAIEHYEQGMALDFNAYYCSCNIAPLLMARGEDGDAQRAKIVDHFVTAACERAIERGEDDAWTRPTLLGAAFRSRDIAMARKLARRIRKEDPAVWHLKATLADIDGVLETIADAPEHGALSTIRDQLRALLG